jgi:vacuolar protein sorting-associated protein 35
VCALSFIPRLKERHAAIESGEDDVPAPTLTLKKVFQYVHKTNSTLVQHSPDVGFQLWLLGAVAADRLGPEMEAISYEFFTQSLVCFEEEISDSNRQFTAIHAFAASLSTVVNLEEENRATLSQKVIQHAAKLLKKPLQVRAISCCAQVYWCGEVFSDEKKVVECLQKCLKILDNIKESDPKTVGLWVEMLDRYVFFAQKGVDIASKVSVLSEACVANIEYADGCKDDSAALNAAKQAKVHLKETAKYIRFLQNNPETAAAFEEVRLPDGY